MNQAHLLVGNQRRLKQLKTVAEWKGHKKSPLIRVSSTDLSEIAYSILLRVSLGFRELLQVYTVFLIFFIQARLITAYKGIKSDG
jgi:hypothetical protein